MSDTTVLRSPTDPATPDSSASTWRADLTAGALVFLLALPLSLGIAMASGFPPVAGLLTAIVGGVVVTWLGSARLTIKGPAAGLIVIALGAVHELGQGDAMLGYRRVLAVGVLAALVQIVFAFARAGSLGDLFPPTVVHGMLAAIGVIIVSKQLHTMMGVTPHSDSPLALLAEVPESANTLDPEVALIGGIGLLLLFVWPLIPRARKLPAPLIVLAFAVPLGLAFALGTPHDYFFAGHSYHIGEGLLVALPDSILDAVTFPQFDVVFSAASLKYVAMFALVGSIESLLSVKAVDQLDPTHHESDLNRDLFAVGMGNLICGLIGGLPLISEIVRSSANIDAGAKSRHANFFHGLILLVCVVAMPFALATIPLAALAAMLVYTGWRLAAPRHFTEAAHLGRGQLFVFVLTFGVTLGVDLLAGVAVGILSEIGLHLANGASFRGLLRLDIEEEIDDETLVLHARGPLVFTNFLRLKRRLDAAAANHQAVRLDLSVSPLVDHTVMGKLRYLIGEGRRIELVGLEAMDALGADPSSPRRHK